MIYIQEMSEKRKNRFYSSELWGNHPPPLKEGGEGDLLSFVAPKPFGVEGSFRWQLKDNYRLNMKPQKKFGLDHLEAAEAATKVSKKSGVFCILSSDLSFKWTLNGQNFQEN